MDSHIVALAGEIDRVLNSPYPTQLKTLHNQVLQTGEDDLSTWAECYACRVHPLARVLVEALPHWPYVWDIIIRMSCAVSIRNAILQVEQSLLEHVISKASELQPGTKKYLETSIAFLSHPLPEHITLPAATQTLLIKLFERAASHPEVSTMKPIYHLLHGACRHLIGVLPFQALSQLEDHLMTIMRSLASATDKTPAIYCLSVMKIIVDEFNTASQCTPVDVWDDLDSSNTSQANTQDRWNPETLAKLFKGSKGQKTLSLVALQVIWACTSGTEKSQFEHCLVSGIMANDILCAVPLNDRKEWWSSSRNVQVVRKLHQRCLVPEMTSALRFQALTFLSSLSDNVSLPQQYVSAYEQIMLEFGTMSLNTEQLNSALELSLPRFAPVFESQWWETFVSSLLDLLVESRALTLLSTTRSLRCLLDQFAAVVEESPQCRQGIIAALSSFRYRQKLDRFLHGPVDIPSQTEGTEYCTKAITASSGGLASSFCSLLLRSALSSRPNELQFPSNLIPGILKKHAVSDNTGPQCASCEQRPRVLHRSALFVEVESTPDAQTAHLPWKERLALKMQAQANDQQQAVIESFTEICRDLEERCENVEAPLRHEQGRFTDLHTRHEQLVKAYDELESQAMDRDLRVNALEAENDSHVAELEAAALETQDLLQRVEDAAKELQQANENARNMLAASKQERHKLELEHATTLVCKQEVLDETRLELQQSHQDLQELRSVLGRLEEGGKQSNAQYERLQLDIRKLEHQLEEKEDQLSQSEEEKRSLSGRCSTLEQEVGHVREESSSLNRQIESLTIELDNVKADSKQEMEKVAASFEDAMVKSRQEWQEMKSHIEEQVEEARRDLVQAEDGFHEQHEADKRKNSELRKRIDRLTKECHKKDAQVIEAQEMRNRLMSAMGLAVPPPMPVGTHTAGPESSSKSSALPYRSASTIATPKPSSQPMLSTPARGAQELDMDDELEANNSDASNVSSDPGPTPKRARPRQSLRKGSMNQQHSIGSRSVKSALRTRSVVNRRPLLDLDTNQSPLKTARSPSKVAFKVIEKRGLGMSTAERRDMEDWSFSNVDILTGTPGFGLKDQTDYLDEESTADVQ